MSDNKVSEQNIAEMGIMDILAAVFDGRMPDDRSPREKVESDYKVIGVIKIEHLLWLLKL